MPKEGKKQHGSQKKKHVLPTPIKFEPYEESIKDNNKTEPDEDASYLNSNPDDPEIQEFEGNDDIPFEDDAEDHQEKKEFYDDSWANELEGENDE